MKDTDVPAFPLNTPKWHEQLNQKGWLGGDLTTGMTLRDYFAAKAMQSSLLASCTNENSALAVLNKAKTGCEFEDWLAYSAYAMADAMLKAREA